jgi:hypothetical protein
MWTIDLINSWAEKMTYRIMQMIGVSQENLDAYVKAIVARDKATDAADDKLSAKLNISEIVKWLAVPVGLFLLYKIYKLYKSR